jgi:hypothetical protein
VVDGRGYVPRERRGESGGVCGAGMNHPSDVDLSLGTRVG